MTTHPTDHPTATPGRHKLRIPHRTRSAPAPAPPAPPAAAPAQRTAVERQPRTRTTPEVRRAPTYYADRERIASYRRTAPRPPATLAGGITTVVVGLAVLNAQWALYPTTYQGQSDANWALLFMMVSTGAALRILMGNPGRHLIAVAAIMACGVGFVLRGLLIGGGEPVAVDTFEVLCGVLLLLGGGMAAAWPVLTVEPPAPISPS